MTNTVGLRLMSVEGALYTARQQAQALLDVGLVGTFRLPTLVAALARVCGAVGPGDDRAADRLMQKARKLSWIEQTERRGEWVLLSSAIKELREIIEGAP